MITRPSAISDDLLFNVAACVVSSLLTSDWKAFVVNLRGFEKLAELRGGLENIGQFCFFDAFHSWGRLCETIHDLQTRDRSSLLQATYPDHPFLPDLCSVLTRYPVGIRELALNRNMSTQVLGFIKEASVWTNDYHATVSDEKQWMRYHTRGTKLVTDLTAILGRYDLLPCERVFCVGLFAYIISSDGRAHPARLPRGLACHLVNVHNLLLSIRTCSDSLLWTAVVVAASVDGIPSDINYDFLLARLIATRLLGEGRKIEWSRVNKIMRKFFWNAPMEKRGRAAWKRAWKKHMEDPTWTQTLELRRPCAPSVSF